MSPTPADLVSAASQPVGPGFDLLLLAHVASVIIAAGAVVASGVQAWRLRALAPGVPVPENLQRYYAEGVNWAGRSLYAVPLFGVTLIAVSGGYYSLSDLWVGIGLGLWFAAALAAEGLLWPAERALQSAVARGEGSILADDATDAKRRCEAVAATAAALMVVLLGVSVLMVAQPR